MVQKQACKTKSETQRQVHATSATYFLTTMPKKHILEKKKEHFQEILQGKLMSACQRMKLDLYWTPCAKKKETSNGSGTYILNLTLMEEKECDVGIGKSFLNTAPFAQELRPAIKK